MRTVLPIATSEEGNLQEAWDGCLPGTNAGKKLPPQMRWRYFNLG